MIGQLSFNGRAIGLSGSTTEVFYIETAHGFIIWAIGVVPTPVSTGGEVRANLVSFARPTSTQAGGPHVTVGLYHLKRFFLKFWSLMMMRRILLVDDELAILLTLKAVLEMNGFAVETATSAREAQQKLSSSSFEMVITDMRMENETSGFEVIRAARSQAYNPATAILTAYPNLGGDWMTAGAESLLVKPMNTGDLLRQIEALLVTHQDSKQGIVAPEIAKTARHSQANASTAKESVRKAF